MMKRPARAASRPASRPRARLALGVESLEGRRLPASIVVSSPDDSGPGTLRQALIDAASDAYPGADDITFAQDLGPIVLTSGQLTIDSPVTITGAPSRTLVARASDAGEFGVFEVAAGVEATLEYLDVTGGSVPDYLGGGVRNWGTLTIRSSAIYGNAARYGGGISSYAYDPGSSASLTLEDVEVANNVGGYGGGVYNAANADATARLTVSSSSFHDNQAEDGGGIYNTAYSGAATLHVSGTTFERDAATVSGGAISNLVFVDGSTAEATLVGVTISGTAAGTGGGVANLAYASDATAALLVDDVAISSPTAELGGGVANVATAPRATAKVAGTAPSGGQGPRPLSLSDASARDGGGVYNWASGGAEAAFLAMARLEDCVATSAGGGAYNAADGAGSTARFAPAAPSNTLSLIGDGLSAAFGGGVFNAAGGAGTASVDVFGGFIEYAAATASGGAVYSQSVGSGSTASVSFVGNIWAAQAEDFGAGILSSAFEGGAATADVRADIRSAMPGRGGAVMNYASGEGSSADLDVERSILISYASAVENSAGGGATATAAIRETSIGLDGLGRRPAGVRNLADGAGSAATLEVDGVEFVGLGGQNGAALDQAATAGGSASAAVAGSTFTNNSATADGGAIRASAAGAGSTSELIVTGSAFAANAAGGDGGAIALSAADGGVGAYSVSGSTFAGDSAGGDGGAIHASVLGIDEATRVEVSGSTFDGESAANDGGAIAVDVASRSQVGNAWTVSIADSTFRDSAAGRDGGTLSITSSGSAGTRQQFVRSTVAGSSAVRNGGAISVANAAGTTFVRVDQSEIGEAVAGTRGGGVASNTGAGGWTQVDVTSSVIHDSSALVGGGASNFSQGPGAYFYLVGSTVHGNSAGSSGGGLHNGSSTTGAQAALLLMSSTVDGNVAQAQGGGVFNIASGATAWTSVESSTIASNRAGQNGGGIGVFVSGPGSASRMASTAGTIAANTAGAQGGGVFNGFDDSYSADVTTFLESTIVADNVGGDLRGAGAFSGTANLVEDGSGAGLTGTIVADPRLGPLADNGGPTRTMALLPGSAAINAGRDRDGFDQRGEGHPRVLLGRADVGAYESPYVPAVRLAGLDATTGDGTYGRGATILVTARFTGPVTVAGVPRIRLNTGGWATYASGSGSDVLTFTYTVSPGESASRLDAASASAWDLNGGSIANADGDPAALATPVGSAPGSLASNANVAIDAVAPVVVDYYVQYGSGYWYRLTDSTRRTLPWKITGVIVRFSKPIGQASLASLSGLSATGVGSFNDRSWVAWNLNGVTQANVLTKLLGTGAAAIKDDYGNPLADGAGHAQPLRVLYGDFDDDGVVTSADMVFPRYNAGSVFFPRYVYSNNIFADLNGDGVVDNSDVLIARSRIGARLP